MNSVKNEHDIVAIVPARGGSKRLPRKNVLELAGKPLIQWTLDAAKSSGVIDLIAVTSDDAEVLEVAGRNDGVRLIHRPESLASDTATSVDAVLHALRVLEEQGVTCKRVMLLQPTSPLRRPEDIRAAVDRMDSTGAASVISVCEMEHSPLWAHTLSEDGCMDNFFLNKHTKRRSQDLPAYYRLNGAIYLVRMDKFMSEKVFYLAPCMSLVMSRSFSIDIDDKNDFMFSEFILNNNA
ncbi:acylneuraminate cytidylyltransferase family protein [Chromohalobacter israelensis]|uniref:acylneuraminate cytidylyltransferase family protein n=1 Tax=Chromohalobacter israelensis TaxID=141390 RepID=UPI001CC80530|nr:acylneuraminate cytidylyltransferase family protein [Chromohalobacter salexigens]MBZ5876642.1 acylneuraminate cytidylyltransferase family protein [Chromohalobacter salexigens]